jgi:phosphoribosylamine-glycine ligase
VLERVDKEILQPTVDGMRSEGFEFKGVLFTGLMMTKNGPKVLEYNVRFGDPETQSLLALMEGDLAEVMAACAEGRLKDVDVKVSSRSAATVVVAAGGYPGSYAKGTVMKLDDVPEGESCAAIDDRRSFILMGVQMSFSSMLELPSQTIRSRPPAVVLSLRRLPRLHWRKLLRRHTRA